MTELKQIGEAKAWEIIAEAGARGGEAEVVD